MNSITVPHTFSAMGDMSSEKINQNFRRIFTSVNNGYPFKAYIAFSGTGTVAAITSQNVSKLTDLGTGHYSITYEYPMTTTAYVILGSASSRLFVIAANSLSLNSANVYTLDTGGNPADSEFVSVAIL